MKRSTIPDMTAIRARPSTRAPKLGLVAVVTCLLLPCFFLLVLKPNFDPFSIWNLQLRIRTTVQLERIEAVKEDISDSRPSGTETIIFPLDLKIEKENQSVNELNAASEMGASPLKKEENEPISDTKMTTLPISDKELQIENSNISSNDVAGKEMTRPAPNLEANQEENKTNEDPKGAHLSHVSEEKLEPDKSTPSILISAGKISCDLSQQRSDTCVVLGDVRVLDHSSIILASPARPDASIDNSTWKIKPYARKWETPVMQYIKELTLGSMNSDSAPRCAVNHSVPAVVFSTGGFLGNFFHDFTDVLVPLFATSHRFQREVQFMVTNFNSQWIDKYRPILNQLSRYKIINLDEDARVHCFPEAHVGLISSKVLGMDPSKTPNGYSMADFKEMLRTSFSLKRRVIGSGNKKPRLLILLRKRSRAFMNKREVVSLGRRLGFKVVLAGSEETKNVTSFARIVNSCDVMMGVHGAGLTNMVFLPTGSPVIQIVPWGGLKWACRHDFGEPAPDMGVKYFEYEIKEEESSLIQQYPRDHAVFTDPLSIQKQGFNALWSVFLDKQKVKLDVRRFKPVLLEALQSVH